LAVSTVCNASLVIWFKGEKLDDNLVLIGSIFSNAGLKLVADIPLILQIPYILYAAVVPLNSP